VIDMVEARFFDPFLYEYYEHLEDFKEHGLEKDFVEFLESVDWAVEAISEYRLPRWARDAYISDVQEKASKLKDRCSSSLAEIVEEIERYFHEEVRRLEKYDSWRWRLLRKLKKMLEALMKPYRAYKKLEESIDSFIASTSRDFASKTSSRFNGLWSRIVYNTSYSFIWILLRLAITAPIIIPLSILTAYFYISFMASNVYTTHLLKLMLVRT